MITFALIAILFGQSVFAAPASGQLTLDATSQSIEAKHHNRVHERKIVVPLGQGRFLAATEYFTRSAYRRAPHRAVLLLQGPEFKQDFWSIPVDGYNASEMLAKLGFFTYTVDYIGSGESYRPADGSTIDYRDQIEPMRKLIEKIRRSRRVPKVDLIGEALGAEVASQLASDAKAIRSVVMSATIYKDLAFQDLVSPEMEALLSSFDDGYWFPPFYEITATFTQPDVGAWMLQTQPDFYPAGNIWILFQEALPYYNPSVARVPGLVIGAQFEPVAGPDDAASLAEDWGTDGAELVIIEGAIHAPRIEAPQVAARFWEEVLNFLNP